MESKAPTTIHLPPYTYHVPTTQVLLLTGFLSIILMRVLKNDFSRYARGDEEDEDEEETGWKLVQQPVGKSRHTQAPSLPPHTCMWPPCIEPTARAARLARWRPPAAP